MSQGAQCLTGTRSPRITVSQAALQATICASFHLHSHGTPCRQCEGTNESGGTENSRVKSLPKGSLAQSYLIQISIRGWECKSQTYKREKHDDGTVLKSALMREEKDGNAAEIKHGHCPAGARPASYRSAG